MTLPKLTPEQYEYIKKQKKANRNWVPVSFMYGKANLDIIRGKLSDTPIRYYMSRETAKEVANLLGVSVFGAS